MKTLAFLERVGRIAITAAMKKLKLERIVESSSRHQGYVINKQRLFAKVNDLFC